MPRGGPTSHALEPRRDVLGSPLSAGLVARSPKGQSFAVALQLVLLKFCKLQALHHVVAELQAAECLENLSKEDPWLGFPVRSPLRPAVEARAARRFVNKPPVGAAICHVFPHSCVGSIRYSSCQREDERRSPGRELRDGRPPQP